MKGIYQYKDLKTDEIVYIGKDSNIDKNKRHLQHLAPSRYGDQQINRVIQNNPNRYEYSVLYSSDDVSEDDLNMLEMSFIERYDPKFNFTMGGEGLTGYKHSEESKQKMSEAKQIYYGTININIIMNLIESLVTIKYAAKELNTTQPTINETLRKAGYETYPNLLYKQIVKKFLEENISISKFAKLNDVPENIVKTALTKHNIRINVETGGDIYKVDKTHTGYRIRERNRSTIIYGISTEERADELCNMLNNNELTLKELKKMKLKGEI